MPTELIAAKLFMPPLRAKLVPRPRLIQLLNEGLAARRKLTLVSAPAGFGKTTLVVAWLSERMPGTAGHAVKDEGVEERMKDEGERMKFGDGRSVSSFILPPSSFQHPSSLIPHPSRVAWLSLDDADNDLPRFLAYMAAAFQQVDEEIGGDLRNALQSPQLPALDRILTGVLNDIAARTDPLILVLDDFHLLTEVTVLQVIDFLLRHQPPNLHLVLTTREDPDLPLARLRARDQLNEIRAGDLRFTRAEAGSFLRGVMGLALSEPDVAALEDRTEGWAVGLQLAGLSMQKQADLKSFIAEFSGSHRHILDYLTGEVIQQQPEDIRTFLLQTAILDRLGGSVCDAVTGRQDGERVLAHLEAANLFVIPLDEERRWYRYHHLFSDLLRAQLARSLPGCVPELHRRASRWYEQQGDIQAAVDHALQDPDPAQAAHLIQQHALPQLYRGQVTRVVGWFDRLPRTALLSDPLLCTYKAWSLALMVRATRRSEAELALQDAGRALDQGNAGEALRDLVAGHAASIRAYMLRSPSLNGEKPEKLIELSRTAQQLLPEQERAIRSVNGLNIGYAYLALADLQAAERAYTQTLEDGLAGGNLYAALYGPINLGMIALLRGRLTEALLLCETYIGRFNQILAGRNFPPIGALHVLKGSILLESDRLAEAEPALMEGLDSIRWTGEYQAHHTGYTALARLRAIQRDRPAMLEALKTLAEAWPAGAFYAQALGHSLSMRHWPDDPGVQQEAQAWLARSGIAFGNLAILTGADPISEATLQTYLGAAQVLARLPKDKPGVYPREEVHAYLKRQAEFAESHEIVRWVVDIAIARTLLYRAAGKQHQALETLEAALRAAAPTGLLRIFLDECDPLRELLEELRPRLADEAVIAHATRLSQAFRCGPAKAGAGEREALLSERELEVLQHLARGLTYEEIGRRLFVSLNTVQFHVKNIYGKLMVNKRVEAIDKAREMHLI